MAVQGNSSDVVVTKGFKTIYGIAPFKVLAINPTQEQLISFGINAQKEPEYLGEKSRLDIWMQTVLPEKPTEGSADKSLEELGLEKQMVQKLTIFLSDANKGKTDGSTQVWINNFGRICSMPAGQQPSASWWKNNGQHVAKEGEIELVKFLRAWCNAGPGDEVYIEDWAALIRGSVKELRDILTTFKNNIVRSMIEVRVTKESKVYAGIYNGHHEPWNIVGLTNWAKEFKEPKAGHHVSFQLKEFVHTAPTPTEDTPEGGASTEKTIWA